MKYIKKYEQKKLPKLDKYLVWKDFDKNKIFRLLENTYELRKSIDGNYDIIAVNHLYNYNCDSDDLSKITSESNSRTSGLIFDDEIENTINKFLVYQSNDLQDCIDILPILATQQKYNI